MSRRRREAIGSGNLVGAHRCHHRAPASKSVTHFSRYSVSEIGLRHIREYAEEVGRLMAEAERLAKDGRPMEAGAVATLAEWRARALEIAAKAQPLGLPDVKMLAKAGISDEVILSQIRNSHAVFHLTTFEIIDLKTGGVSEKVIDFMINTASQK